MNDELTALFEQQARNAANLAQLHIQSANKTENMTELESLAIGSKRHAKYAKVVLGPYSGVSPPLTAMYSELLAKQDGFKNGREALTLKNQCIPG